MTDLNQATELTHKAIKELRDTVESKIANFAEGKEKVEKIEKDLDAMEVKNQELMLEIAKQKNIAEKLEEKYDYLDASYSAQPTGVSHKKLDQEYKADMGIFNAYCKHGFNQASGGIDVLSQDIQAKYLRTDSNTEGGFLVPVDFVREIIKNLTEVSPIRAIASVRTTNTKSMEQPIRTTILTSGWVGEGATGTTSNSTYGNRRIHVKKNFVQAQITVEDLRDAAFDMESEIRTDVVEEFAKKEGLAFVSGDGINQPFGFMTSSDVSSINSGSAADITFDNFFDLQANLKTGYLSSALYGLNRFTLGRVRKLKTSGSGEYLWTAGNLAAGVPNAIGGQAYVEIPDLDNIAANAYPVIFADFKKFYQIADRLSLEVVRDEVTKALEGKVLFNYFMRVGGDVRQPEAGIKLKCST